MFAQSSGIWGNSGRTQTETGWLGNVSVAYMLDIINGTLGTFSFAIQKPNKSIYNFSDGCPDTPTETKEYAGNKKQRDQSRNNSGKSFMGKRPAL